MRLFDSHAHLTDESFAAELPEILTRAAEGGVEAVTSIASDPTDAAAALRLAGRGRLPRIYATAGLHPHAAQDWSIHVAERLDRLAASHEVVAIGETGLDFHYDNAPRAVQIDAFRGQIELAERHELPLVVHSRDAEAETAEILREHAGRVIGVLHCFTGGEELLRVGLAADWYVSFSGIITFNSFRSPGVVRAVPTDRLLVETDSPYLAPVPVRGRRNEPANVAHVVRRLAEIRDTDPQDVAAATFDNACRCYRCEP